MIKKINNTERINNDLRVKGLVKVLNEPEHIQAILDLNKQMAKVRRDFKYKNSKSEQSAKNFYLT